LAAAGALPALAQTTIVFRDNTNVVSSDNIINIPNYQGTQDSTMDSGSPTNNMGAWIDFEVGSGSGSADRDSVIRFDVTSLNGQYNVVNAVHLRLFLYGNGFSGNSPNLPRALDVTRINATDNWVEGTMNGPIGTPQPGSACWTAPQLGGPGWNPGAPLAMNFTVFPGQQNSYIDIPLGGNLTALIGGWVTNPQNAGMRVSLNAANSPLNSGLLFGSRDNPTGVEFIPELFIDYSPIPAPASLAPMLLAGTLVTRRRRSR